MGTLWQDLRYGFRVLLKRPGFTAAAVVTLALGVGANGAVFSVFYGVLLRPLPFQEPERLVQVWEVREEAGGALEMTSMPNLLDWRDRNTVFAGVAAWERPSSLTLTSRTPATALTGSPVTVNLFQLLGVAAARGRTFTEDEQTPGQQRVVVLSHGLWQKEFGGRADVVGMPIRLGEREHRVVGVMPRDFESPTGAVDLWLPLTLEAESTDRGQNYLQAVARLAPGVTLEQAQAQMGNVAAGLSEQYPDTNRGWGVRLVPVYEQMVGGVRPVLLLVFSAVGLVLLISFANVTNLLLVRAAGREREVAIRAALGATRWRLMRQVLIESLILTSAGGGLGILAAYWTLPVLKALAPDNIPRMGEIGVGAVTVLFTAGVSLAAGLLLGLPPALYAGGRKLGATLPGSRNVTARSWRAPLRQTFVVSQVSLACLLLIGAGLLAKSFWRLHHVAPGFDADNVLVVRLALGQHYSDNHRRIEYFRGLTERLRAIPSVRSAGAATVLPLNAYGIDFDVPYYREGEPEPQKSAAPKARFRSATPDYFRAMAVPLAGGREFDERDRPDSPAVVIVNDALARRAWPGEDPVGKRLRFFWADWQTYEVVGVVGDTKSYGLAEATQPELFVPYAQNPYTIMNVVVRTAAAPESAAAAVGAAVLAQDSQHPPHSVTTMADLLRKSVAREKFSMVLLALLSGLAVALAAVGLYGVISYTVSQRLQEIGVRLALGAQGRDILGMVLGQGMRLTAAGLALGLAAALALTRLMSGLLYGVSETDAGTFVAVTLILAGAAFSACYVPARRATKVDPLIALRHE